MNSPVQQYALACWTADRCPSGVQTPEAIAFSVYPYGRWQDVKRKCYLKAKEPYDALFRENKGYMVSLLGI